MSAGQDYSCAIATAGTLACWGLDTDGQSSPPGGTYTAVAAGQLHACATRTDGRVVCWGSNGHGESTVPQDFG